MKQKVIKSVIIVVIHYECNAYKMYEGDVKFMRCYVKFSKQALVTLATMHWFIVSEMYTVWNGNEDPVIIPDHNNIS